MVTTLPVGRAGLSSYLAELGGLLERIPVASVEALHLAIVRAYERDAQIFVVGNGGSAATATHLACDLSKNTRAPGRRRARVLSLTDNVAALTAWANDDGYSNVFAEQLAALIRPGDLLVAISGSGRSPNVLAAVQCAAACGARTAALTGFDGGQLSVSVDHAVVVPSERMELIEDAHLAICHALTAALRAEIAMV
jgi:D-sedoheptulose 7-phosphate isomerase